MDHFTLVDAAGFFLGALAVLILQSFRQAPVQAQGAGLWAVPARADAGAGIGPDAVLMAGPVVGRLGDADCHDYVMLRDGRRMRFAGAVALLPDGRADLRWTPGDALVLHGRQLYLPDGGA